MKKILSGICLICFVAMFCCNCFAADCVFTKNGEEMTRIWSGDIVVSTSVGAVNLLGNAEAKMMSNDGVTEETSAFSSTTADKSIDGESSTMARARNKDWNLLIDLKASSVVDEIRVNFPNNLYPKAYRVETASSDASWTTIAEVSDNTAGGEYNYTFSPCEIQYIRITNTDYSKQMGISEIGVYNSTAGAGVLVAGLYDGTMSEVYGLETVTLTPNMTPDQACTTVLADAGLIGLPESEPVQENLARGATGRLCSSNSANTLNPSGSAVAANAFDGSVSTFACAGGEWAWMFEVDFAEVKQIGQVILTFTQSSYPLSYDILASEDGETWQIVKSITGNSDGGVKKLSFETIPAQFIRVRDNVAQENVRQMCIAEFEAYENSFETDWQVRAFVVNNETDKLPLDDAVYVLNDGAMKESVPVTQQEETDSELFLEGRIKTTWIADEGDKPLVIWIQKNGETVYANMLMPNEYQNGELEYYDASVAEGDVFDVQLSGATTFSKQLTYEKAVLAFVEFKKLLADIPETSVSELLLDSYGEYNNLQYEEELKTLSDTEEISVEEIILNETYDSFVALSTLLDARYEAILEERQAQQNIPQTPVVPVYPSYGGGGGGGSFGGGVSLKAEKPIEEAKNQEIPQPENEYEYQPVLKMPEFTDIETVNWAKDSIIALYNKGVISGINETTFAPDNQVTRGEFIKMLVVAFDAEIEGATCSFTDVAEEHWAFSYIASAYSSKIVNGISKTYFGVSEAITRQDASVMLYRFLKSYNKQIKSGSAKAFSDKDDIADYALTAVNAMSGAGVINGMADGSFVPLEHCTRAQAAKMIYTAVYGGM